MVGSYGIGREGITYICLKLIIYWHTLGSICIPQPTVCWITGRTLVKSCASACIWSEEEVKRHNGSVPDLCNLYIPAHVTIYLYCIHNSSTLLVQFWKLKAIQFLLSYMNLKLCRAKKQQLVLLACQINWPVTQESWLYTLLTETNL